MPTSGFFALSCAMNEPKGSECCDRAPLVSAANGASDTPIARNRAQIRPLHPEIPRARTRAILVSHAVHRAGRKGNSCLYSLSCLFRNSCGSHREILLYLTSSEKLPRQQVVCRREVDCLVCETSETQLFGMRNVGNSIVFCCSWR